MLNALITEGVSWLLIYRTEDYKRLKREIETLSKRVEQSKEERENLALSERSKKMHKRLARDEEALKLANSQLAMSKFKSVLAMMFIMASTYGLLASIFDGIAVAVLPFEPISFVRTLSHRNLAGQDFYDCSFAFFYVLCSLTFKQNVQKLGGHVPRSAASLFQPPEESK
jgi:calcium load-activated calcium channel